MISITAEFSRVLVCLRSTVSIPSFTPQNKGFPSMEVAMLPYEVQQILNGVGLTDTVKQCVGSPLSLVSFGPYDYSGGMPPKEVRVWITAHMEFPLVKSLMVQFGI